MAMPTADAIPRDITTITDIGIGSGVEEMLSCAALPAAVATAAAIPLIQDVDQTEYIEKPPNG
jgi:hypothetical protein